MPTTVGRLLIDEALPEEYRGRDLVLDKKGLSALLREVGERHPEKYREVSKKLADVGRDAAYTSGGNSFGLQHLRSSVAGRRLRHELGKQLREIYDDPRLSDEARDKKIVDVTGGYQKQLVEDVLKEATDADNPLAQQLLGAGRGNKVTLNSLLGADLLYTDHRDNVVPVPVTKSYSMGLTPVQYFAGAYGARKGIIDTKLATSRAGFAGKQLVQAAHRLLVTADDDDNPYDVLNPRGLPVDTSDPDNEGALLAHAVGDYPRNTELTPKILKDLRNRGHDQILVRSPTVGGPADGGVYARDAGRREKGRLAPIGDYVGVAAAQGLTEPLSQSQLSSKHSGGVAGAGAGAVSGFQAINSLIQVPKTYPGGATHAQLDGHVKQVAPAPQGGFYVTVGDKQHYVPRDRPVTVKVGDTVEAGDTLSDGIPNPAEIVAHKGIGEGRRYFVQAMHKTLVNSGISAHRRNIELIGRGLINHVQLTDELDNWAPDDVIPYQSLERSWEPRAGHVTASPSSAVGKYLERPVLHYSLGTKIRPSMLPQLQKFGVNQVLAHADPPPFEATMVRGMANISQDQDWLTKMLGSYQSKSLLESARRGATSDEAGTSYVPALARGETFGLQGPTKGWKP